MKAIIAAAVGVLMLGGAAQAQYGTRYTTSPHSYGTGSNPNSHYVQPHITSNGNLVDGHYRTNPNSTTLDNYGTRGNLNPYTGTFGTRRPGF